MANVKYNLVSFNGDETLTVFADGRAFVANNTHPKWDEIKRMAVIDDDPSVVDVIDGAVKAVKEFKRLGAQVTVSDGRLFFDGDEVNNAVAKKVVEFINEGVEDWKPLVAFMEKVFTNPETHSREQLFEWMERHAFSINEEGDILGYKSVRRVREGSGQFDGFEFQSISSGSEDVMVDGKVFIGYIPQNVGSVVEMPRSVVQHDPSNGCGVGLHVANYRYATTWSSSDAVLLVAVNPRDVVSVPTESNFEKVRVCRYRVVKVVDGETTGAVVREKPEPVVEEVPTPVFTVGDSVKLVGGQWVDYAGQTHDNLQRLGVALGALGKVSPNTLGGHMADNVKVEFDGYGTYYVHPNSLSIVLEAHAVYSLADSDDELDSWENEGGSWDNDYSW